MFAAPAEAAGAGRVAALVAAVVAFIICAAYVFGTLCAAREGFASRAAHEVFDAARGVFAEGGGDATYTSYKKKVPDADPVQYVDVRRLFRAGEMSPSSVERVL